MKITVIVDRVVYEDKHLPREVVECIEAWIERKRNYQQDIGAEDGS